MTAILDLDYTLLDTERFKKALAFVFTDCGIAEERFLRTYQEVVEHGLPAYDYNPDRHIALLANEITCPQEELRAKVKNVISDIVDFLYLGTEEFIAELRKLGFRVVLLTLGNIGWQKEKVEHSGLAKLFDDIVLVRSNKELAISKFADAERPVIVINDNCDEIVAMRKVEPSLHYIVKRGPKGVPDKFDVTVCETFEEILAEIKARLK